MDKLPKDLKLLVVQKAHLIWVRKQKKSKRKPVYRLFCHKFPTTMELLDLFPYAIGSFRKELFRLLEVDALVYYRRRNNSFKAPFLINLVNAELCSRLGMPLSY